MDIKAIIFVCGLHSLGFAIFHIAFWRMFDWPKSLLDTTIANNAILQIENIQLIWVLLLVAALCFAFPDQLAGTRLGRAMLAGMSFFWTLRFIVQFVFLRYNRVTLHALSALFAMGAAIFALPLFV